jgi:hypothetical protein
VASGNILFIGSFNTKLSFFSAVSVTERGFVTEACCQV